MNPIWRTRITGIVAGVIGVFLAVQIANGAWLWPVLATGTLMALGLLHFQPFPLSTLLLGIALCGYITGNRGFAQLSAFPGLPLFPAEFVFLIASGILLITSALKRELPVRRDALNLLILLWMTVSTFRLYHDLRVFGAAALRDYATVYYASFFFLAQWAAQSSNRRRFLHGCILFSCAGLIIILPLFDRFPEVFLEWLVIGGIPLVFFKGDLAAAFMAVGAVLLFLRHEERRSWWSLVLSLLLTAGVVATNSRAALLGLIVAIGILALAGRWKFALVQAAAGVSAALVILFVAYLRNESWEQTPLHSMYERVISVTDPHGVRAYSGEETFNKGDNNLFRTVWWRVSIEETLAGNPWLGLGWGHDLAREFVRVYYPESGDDFITRSPHNVLVTLFARSGAIGLAGFLLVIGAMAQRTWQAARRGTPAAAGLWSACWVILTSATLGVVLEGPMGAVVFWSLLGIASAETAAAATPAVDSEAAAEQSESPPGQPELAGTATGAAP